MADDLDPEIADAELSDFTRDAREFCRQLEVEIQAEVEPVLEAHLGTYRCVLDALATLLALVPEKTALELAPNQPAECAVVARESVRQLWHEPP